ncbi:hypothetical protein ABVK25_008702 [Lepraria finkii]|uniref:Uncharacterized protein n=1 Tax=Lepraria finkii TaxID=1340010 RepID=A0ABR4B118_9LECA
MVRHASPWNTFDLIQALTWAIDQWIRIRDPQPVKVAVMSLAFGDNVGPNYQSLTDSNSSGVASNYPAMYTAVPGLLVVGATDNNGRIKSGQDLTSMANYVSLFAPGAGVWVAENDAADSQITGTSAFCATVTDQTAWPRRVDDIRYQLLATEYSRNPAGSANALLAIWNGLALVNGCQVQPMKHQRDGSSASVCSVESSTSSLPASCFFKYTKLSSFLVFNYPIISSTAIDHRSSAVQVSRSPLMVGNLNDPAFNTAIINALRA